MTDKFDHPQYKVGILVTVESRTWPGINKPGGVGKITKFWRDDDGVERVNVKYVLGGSEKNIEVSEKLPATWGPNERIFFQLIIPHKKEKESDDILYRYFFIKKIKLNKSILLIFLEVSVPHSFEILVGSSEHYKIGEYSCVYHIMICLLPQLYIHLFSS